MYIVIKRGRNQPSISTAFSIHLAELYEPLAALSFFAGDGNFFWGEGRDSLTLAPVYFGGKWVVWRRVW